MGPRHQTYLRPRTVQAKPVTTSGTPPPLCTFRPARRSPVTAKTPAACDPHPADGAGDPVVVSHGSATQWRMNSYLNQAAPLRGAGVRRSPRRALPCKARPARPRRPRPRGTRDHRRPVWHAHVSLPRVRFAARAIASMSSLMSLRGLASSRPSVDPGQHLPYFRRSRGRCLRLRLWTKKSSRLARRLNPAPGPRSPPGVGRRNYLRTLYAYSAAPFPMSNSSSSPSRSTSRCGTIMSILHQPMTSSRMLQ